MSLIQGTQPTPNWQLEQAKYAAAATLGGNSALDQIKQGPLREGGLQMRLIETVKLLTDANLCMCRIESHMGMPGNPAAPVRPIDNQINLDTILAALREQAALLSERLAHHESLF